LSAFFMFADNFRVI